MTRASAGTARLAPAMRKRQRSRSPVDPHALLQARAQFIQKRSIAMTICTACVGEPAPASKSPAGAVPYEVRVEASGAGFRSQLEAGEFQIVLDAGRSLGGEQSGPSPVQAFLSSIVACTQASLAAAAGVQLVGAAASGCCSTMWARGPRGRLPIARGGTRLGRRCASGPSDACSSHPSAWPLHLLLRPPPTLQITLQVVAKEAGLEVPVSEPPRLPLLPLW